MTTRMTKFAFSFLTSLSLMAAAPSAAQAATCSANDAAEVTRLRGELAKLVGKNQHSGAVATFEKMLALGKKKCEIRAEDYVLAGTSARNLGDIERAIEWLEAGGSTDAADLRARFGRVDIKEKAGDLTKDGGMPFSPDERAALEGATRDVKAKGKYKGYLPAGSYTLGGKTFQVTAGALTKV